MLLVIMTRSLIRLDNTVRASLNNDCMTNRYDDRHGKARTEHDRDSHSEWMNMIMLELKTIEAVMVIMKSYESITRSYRRYN